MGAPGVLVPTASTLARRPCARVNSRCRVNSFSGEHRLFGLSRRCRREAAYGLAHPTLHAVTLVPGGWPPGPATWAADESRADNIRDQTV